MFKVDSYMNKIRVLLGSCPYVAFSTKDIADKTGLSKKKVHNALNGLFVCSYVKHIGYDKWIYDSEALAQPSHSPESKTAYTEGNPLKSDVVADKPQDTHSPQTKPWKGTPSKEAGPVGRSETAIRDKTADTLCRHCDRKKHEHPVFFGDAVNVNEYLCDKFEPVEGKEKRK